jgi:SAM-dependent methyltransferase
MRIVPRTARSRAVRALRGTTTNRLHFSTVLTPFFQNLIEIQTIASWLEIYDGLDARTKTARVPRVVFGAHAAGSQLGRASMLASQHVPWQLKVAAKLVLARVPLGYRIWRRVGIFRLGGMERPEYALGVFRWHFDTAAFQRKREGFVALELGPGDSLDSAIIAKAFGASQTYLVDIGRFASADLGCYRRMESHLHDSGLHPPDLSSCRGIDDFMSAASARYLTEGLNSLREIPTASVDFVWSHAVLQHVRRDEFFPTLKELRRIQRPDGIASHRISIRDILGGNLNDLRFSDRVWESRLMAQSGFYTNRIRYEKLLELFREAGFTPEIRKISRWRTLPTPRKKMDPQFASLPEEDLSVSGFDVFLR